MVRRDTADSGGAQHDGGPEVTPAATVVPLRDGVGGLEVLMLRRNGRGPFGGMWVFPGGQIDPADWPDAGPAANPHPGPQAPGQAAARAGTGRGWPAADGEAIAWRSGDLVEAARRAAVREAREEASLALDPDTLVLHSWWLPPARIARRFATWFFLAPVGDAPEVVVDGTEIYEHRWFPPADAHLARDRGEVALAPPTWVTLWWLGQFNETAAALAAAASRRPEHFETRILAGEGSAVAVWAGDAAYESGDLGAAGRRRRVWMASPSWRAEIDSP